MTVACTTSIYLQVFHIVFFSHRCNCFGTSRYAPARESSSTDFSSFSPMNSWFLSHRAGNCIYLATYWCFTLLAHPYWVEKSALDWNWVIGVELTRFKYGDDVACRTSGFSRCSTLMINYNYGGLLAAVWSFTTIMSTTYWGLRRLRLFPYSLPTSSASWKCSAYYGTLLVWFLSLSFDAVSVLARWRILTSCQVFWRDLLVLGPSLAENLANLVTDAFHKLGMQGIFSHKLMYIFASSSITLVKTLPMSSIVAGSGTLLRSSFICCHQWHSDSRETERWRIRIQHALVMGT